MIKWETIVSTADDKLTLLEWLKMVEKAINDGALTGISVQQSDASHATITFSFAGDPEQSFTLTLPQGEQGEKGEPGTPGADGTDGTNGRDALVQNRALSSANITSPMAIPIEALNRTAVQGEPIVMFATDTTEKKTYMLIGTVTKVGIPDVNPYTFVTYSSKVDITGIAGPEGLDALSYIAGIEAVSVEPTNGGVTFISRQFNRMPVVGDSFTVVYSGVSSSRLKGRSWLAVGVVSAVSDDIISCNITVTETTGAKGTAGEIINRYMHTITYFSEGEPLIKFTVFSSNSEPYDNFDYLNVFFGENNYTTEDTSYPAMGVYENEGVIYNVWGIYYNDGAGSYYAQYGNDKIGYELGIPGSGLTDTVIDLVG